MNYLLSEYRNTDVMEFLKRPLPEQTPSSEPLLCAVNASVSPFSPGCAILSCDSKFRCM